MMPKWQISRGIGKRAWRDSNPRSVAEKTADRVLTSGPVVDNLALGD